MLAEWCSIWKCLQCNVWIRESCEKGEDLCDASWNLCICEAEEKHVPVSPTRLLHRLPNPLSSRDLCFHYLLPLRHVNILPTLCPHVFIKVCSTRLVVNIFEFPMHCLCLKEKHQNCRILSPNLFAWPFPMHQKTAACIFPYLAFWQALTRFLIQGWAGKAFGSREREGKLKITFPFYGKGTGIRKCYGKGREIWGS